ncbi:glycosyltransferase 87 family protein [Jatrophihabitans sp.]|uniref:glycosyltransferase 87 family protein n=1 Tax=Jatrophihabitans sp. TaxID=1932789 RepID=UPI0030C6AAEE|nr:hypothetical protein [Jatrophihabitans sp.]
MQVRASRVVAAAALLAEAVLFASYLHVDSGRNGHLWLETTTTIAFLVAVAALRWTGLAPRHLAVAILLGGAVLQLVALSHSPQTSDDDFRYIWDGKVQLSGTDPYRYPPASPSLSSLRAAPIFGTDGPCTYRIPGSCVAINRPTVHTIYPPVAEAAFTAVRLLSFGGHGVQLPFQIAAALGSCLIGLLLAHRALGRGDPVWTVALWAWCPVVVYEFGNNAHIDWLAVLLVVLGLRAYAADRLGRAGVLIGAAIATKLYPGLLLASLLRRRPWLVLASSLGFVALTYVPHVAAVGSSVIGYLPGYLHEEGYSTGNHLLLLGAVFPHPIDTAIGVLIVAAGGVWAWRRTEPSAPENTAVVVLGLALLVATPRYGWYAALLVALIAMSRRIEWLPVAFASSFVYLSHGTPSDPAIFAIAGGLTLTALLVRHRRQLPALVGRGPVLSPRMPVNS